MKLDVSVLILLCLGTLVSAGVKVTHIKGPKKCERKSRKEDEITFVTGIISSVTLSHLQT